MMIRRGIHWPDDTRPPQIEHALRHLSSLKAALKLCRRHGVAVQAGGNIGLWPRELAKHFRSVMTFEPEPVSRDCLLANVANLGNVQVFAAALGEAAGSGHVSRKSLGSHKMSDAGAPCPIVALDDLDLDGLDFLQLDIEGYELIALRGGRQIIDKHGPVIQVELRNFGDRYDAPDSALRDFLAGLGYKRAAKTGGCDEVFVRR